jgi:hypothetical protein
MPPRLFLRQAERALSATEKPFAVEYNIKVSEGHTVVARGRKHVREIRFTGFSAYHSLRIGLIKHSAHSCGAARY